MYTNIHTYNMKTKYDVTVIGYGVAGLSLGHVLNKNIKSVFIENGNDIDKRDHNDSIGSLIGCGGAGLFSDGKFSFFPSGTEVWKLEKILFTKSLVNLSESLQPFIPSLNLLENLNKQISAFPPQQFGLTEPYRGSDKQIEKDKIGWFYKYYPSHYINLENRLKLISNLKNNANVLYNHNVITVKKKPNHYTITVINCTTNKTFKIKTTYVVFAGGRFMPLYFKSFNTKFKRVEFGARFVADGSNSSMKQNNIVDPKYILSTPEFEARTFCWCKNGEIVLTNNNLLLNGSTIQTYSGRADLIDRVSCESNFGLNIRIKNENKNNIDDLLKVKPYCIYLCNFNAVTLVHELQSKMGKEYGLYFYEALLKFMEKFPSFSFKNVKLVGPTIEGVGYYADIDSISLKMNNENIYCVGDCTGLFRGIVASMISGFFIGHTLNSHLCKN